MKVLIMDMKGDAGTGIDLGIRAREEGHEVCYWAQDHHGIGQGVLEISSSWRQDLEASDLTVLTGNCDYPPTLDECFGSYPIFGTNPKAAALELDRARGQDVLSEHGIETLPYEVVDSTKEAIDFLVKAGRPYAIKPWGGACDKSLTCVPRTVDDAIFHLQKAQREGKKVDQLMLQEMVEGIEIGVSGFFGPGGWSTAIEESFEHKKLMNDDKGPNTGEMGTVIRHVKESKLFDLLLEPLGDYLHLCNFVGDCSVNCIVDSSGTPWPLEFTMRLGWPDFCIRQELIRSDPVEWMADLLYGRDTLRVSDAIAVGIVMAHGDFPAQGHDK